MTAFALKEQVLATERTGSTVPDQSASAKRRQLDQFLAGVERKALAIAEMSLWDRDEAMDVVQDAMIRLVRSYSDRPEAEWAPLFFRILNNRERDVQRRRQVRNRFMSWFGGSGDDDHDPIAAAPNLDQATPGEELEALETHARLTEAVKQLPERQREAFLLRSLEGFDTAQTAEAMGCSEGSVKTHYSRALNALRAALAR
ncbi:MAG: RNA polymerase sigma factor [Pseudomonadota bacterium]